MSGSPSLARDCLLLARSHSSSIYPSAVSLFVLLSLSFVVAVPSPLSLSFSLLSLLLCLAFSPRSRELHEQVLRSSPYRIPRPSPFLSRTMFHHSIRNLFSRTRALRILQPADHIITLFIKPTATATIQSSSPPRSAYRAAFSRGGPCSIHWTQPRARFNLPIPITSSFPHQLNPSAIISADRYSDSSSIRHDE